MNTVTHIHAVRSNNRIYRYAVGAVVACSLLASAAHAQTVVRVSVKVFNDHAGRLDSGLYTTDGQIQDAIAQANTALTGIGANWRLQLVEIADVVAPDFFYMGCGDLPQLEQAAQSQPAAFAWRTDAINMYVANINEDCGGACSFPHGITGSQEAIVINNFGIGGDGVGWLHEIGHYFGLWHSFQCMRNGEPCDESDLNTCTGAGGIDRRCDDACPDHTNVMSYHEGVHEHNATLSPCQLDVVATQMATTRRHVLASGSVVTPDPQPVAPQATGDDTMEDNDTADRAIAITDGSLQLIGADDDWFTVQCQAAGRLSVRITGESGDLDLIVFDAASGDAIGVSESSGSNEQVELDIASGEYAILVYPYDGQPVTYTLTVATPSGAVIGTPQPQPGHPTSGDDAMEDNDTPEQARPIQAGSYDLIGADEDWFVMNVTGGAVSVQVEGTSGDLDVIVFDASTGDVLAASEQAGSSESVEVAVGTGAVAILVYPYDGTPSPYRLTVSASDTTGPVAPQPRPTQPVQPTPFNPEPGSPQPLDIDVTIDIPQLTVDACGAGTPPMLGLGLLGLMGAGLSGRRRIG